MQGVREQVRRETREAWEHARYETHVPREHLGQEARRAGQYVEYEAREQVGTREGGTRHDEETRAHDTRIL